MSSKMLVRLLLIITLCATFASAQARDLSLPPAVTQALRSQGLPQGSLSVLAQDLDNEDVVLSLNADQPRQPASTIKALTTFVALDLLGPAYTWKTRAFINGKLQDGVLNGDLIIVGGGDPYMTAERWWRFVTGIREQGVKTITGDIVIDHGYFAAENPDRSAFDGEPEKPYNVIPDALLVNFQTSEFTLTGQLDGHQAALIVDPLPANLEVGNHVQLRGHNCRRGYQDLRISTPSGANGKRIDIAGRAARDCGSIAVARAIMTAPDYAYGTFRTYFEQQGGHIKGGLRLQTLPATAKLLFTQDSLTLGEIIRLINKYSNNVMARTLLLTLAAEQYGAPATLANGRRVINDWLQSHKIDNDGWVIDNGSGLSRLERVTASGMVSVLKTAWQSQWLPEFAASLPLAATDGTLRNRFQASGMRGRLRLKTGHLDNVASLAGYVNAASGRHFVVAIFINSPAVLYGGDEVQAAILRWIFAQ